MEKIGGGKRENRNHRSDGGPKEDGTKYTEADYVLQLRSLVDTLSVRKDKFPEGITVTQQDQQGLIIDFGGDISPNMTSGDVRFSRVVVTDDNHLKLGTATSKYSWDKLEAEKRLGIEPTRALIDDFYERVYVKEEKDALKTDKDDYKAKFETALKESLQLHGFVSDNIQQGELLQTVMSSLQRRLVEQIGKERGLASYKGDGEFVPERESDRVEAFFWTCLYYPGAMNNAQIPVDETKLDEDRRFSFIKRGKLSLYKHEIEIIPVDIGEETYYLKFFKSKS